MVETGELIYQPLPSEDAETGSRANGLVVIHPVWLSKLFNTIISPQNFVNSVGVVDIEHLKTRLWVSIDVRGHDKLLDVIVAFGVC